MPSYFSRGSSVVAPHDSIQSQVVNESETQSWMGASNQVPEGGYLELLENLSQIVN